MASFSNIFVLFLPEILLSVSCCNVLYVSILLSRLFLRSKSVAKCSTGQSFTRTKVSSYRIGTLIINSFWLSKNEKLAKKVDFRKSLDPIWDLALKRVSKFVIPEFRDTLLVPKITKCGDLLYHLGELQKESNNLSLLKNPKDVIYHSFQ